MHASQECVELKDCMQLKQGQQRDLGRSAVEKCTEARQGAALLQGREWVVVNSSLGLNPCVCRFNTSLPRMAYSTCFPMSTLLSQKDITSR